VSGRPSGNAASREAAGPIGLDTDRTRLYHSYVNNAVASAMVRAAHRVEARLEGALAGVGLSIAKFETLSILVSQDRPISLSELAAKLVCVRSNVTQLVDRLETEGLVKRAYDPADRRAVRAEVTALGRKRQAAGAPVVNAVLQDVANKLAAIDSQKLKRALDAIQ
jgi:DNA-binding MarR family transcriptional regulator